MDVYAFFEELTSISKSIYCTKLKLFDDEVWKSGRIAGFSRYEISNYGRIKRLKEEQLKSTGINDTLYKSIVPEKILTGHLAEDGYVYVTLKDDNDKKVTTPAHRLVAFVFCSKNRPEIIEYNTKNNIVVDHINRIKNDNRAINLRWVSYSINGKNVNKNKNVKYDYKHPLFDPNARETDLINDVIPNESPRWFTKVNFVREEWRLVKGYEEYRVMVSNYGRILKPIYHSVETYISYYNERKSYFLVALPQRSFEKTQKIYRVHQLVAQEFMNYEIGSVDETGQKFVIDHIDTDKHNNSIFNLRICTQKENMNNELTLKHYEKKTNYSALSYRVNAYEYPSGNFIRQFDNYVETKNYFDVAINVVSKVCLGKEAAAYSKKYNKYYIFRTCELNNIDDRTNLWESDIFNIYDLYNEKNLFTKNKRERIFNIYEYPSGKFVKQYNSFNVASNELGITINSISKAIVGTTVLLFSKNIKRYYLVRRINFENMNNFSNIFDSGLLNIGDCLITKEDIDKAYNPNLEKYINLYSYPSGKFIKQFSYVEDVLEYFDGRLKNHTVYKSLIDSKTIIKDDVYKMYFVMKYVDEKSDIFNINVEKRPELNLIVNREIDGKIVNSYDNIFEIAKSNSNYDIDAIFYSIKEKIFIDRSRWYFTRKHNQELSDREITVRNRNIISVNKYSLFGKFIEHYDDLFDVSLERTKIDNIRKCINGSVQSAYGFIWKKLSECNGTEDLVLTKPAKCQQLYFSAYDENDNFIESFKSSKIAAEKYSISIRKIYRMLDKEVYIEYNGIKVKFKRDDYNGL